MWSAVVLLHAIYHSKRRTSFDPFLPTRYSILYNPPPRALFIHAHTQRRPGFSAVGSILYPYKAISCAFWKKSKPTMNQQRMNAPSSVCKLSLDTGTFYTWLGTWNFRCIIGQNAERTPWPRGLVYNVMRLRLGRRLVNLLHIAQRTKTFGVAVWWRVDP